MVLNVARRARMVKDMSDRDGIQSHHHNELTRDAPNAQPAEIIWLKIAKNEPFSKGGVKFMVESLNS